LVFFGCNEPIRLGPREGPARQGRAKTGELGVSGKCRPRPHAASGGRSRSATFAPANSRATAGSWIERFRTLHSFRPVGGRVGWRRVGGEQRSPSFVEFVESADNIADQQIGPHGRQPGQTTDHAELIALV